MSLNPERLAVCSACLRYREPLLEYSARIPDLALLEGRHTWMEGRWMCGGGRESGGEGGVAEAGHGRSMWAQWDGEVVRGTSRLD